MWLHCFIISKAICERSCYSVFLQNPWNCHNLNFCHSDGYFLASCYVYSCISLIIENEAIYLVFLIYKIPILFFYLFFCSPIPPFGLYIFFTNYDNKPFAHNCFLLMRLQAKEIGFFFKDVNYYILVVGVF